VTPNLPSGIRRLATQKSLAKPFVSSSAAISFHSMQDQAHARTPSKTLVENAVPFSHQHRRIRTFISSRIHLALSTPTSLEALLNANTFLLIPLLQSSMMRYPVTVTIFHFSAPVTILHSLTTMIKHEAPARPRSPPKPLQLRRASDASSSLRIFC
jgi:hypothetical protein